jgi:hypothetical protein
MTETAALPTYEIAIKATVDEQFLRDCLVTAVETPFGSWWWSEPGTCVRDAELNILTINLAIDDPNEEEGSGKHTPWKTVTPADLVPAIQKIIDYRLLGGSYMNYLLRAVRDCDAGDVDAIVADAILQVLILGEVVYG